jgi:hypothetical protein
MENRKRDLTTNDTREASANEDWTAVHIPYLRVTIM